jgi:hypothetical protein
MTENGQILHQLEEISKTLTDHRIETAKSFASLSENMVEVLGENGNPGRLGRLEKKVSEHETKINRASGAFGILLVVGGGLHWLVDALRSTFHK